MELRYRYTTVTDIGHISLYEFQLVFEIPVQIFFRCLLNVSALGFFFLLQASYMLIKNLHYVWRNQVLGFTSHVFLELHNNFRKPYIHSSLFIIGLYTEVLHCFGGTADRCRVSIYPYRWQAQGVRGSGLALTAMYTPLSH